MVRLLSLPGLNFSTTLAQIAVNANFWLFLFVVVFAITQRMIPFFTSVKFADYNINKSKFLIEKIYAFLLLNLTGSVLGAGVELIAGGGLCMIFVFELRRWQLSILRAEAIL